MNHRLLDTFQGKVTDRPPIWMMRQAGRYLPEYQAVRAEAKDFLTLCKTPELACEVTLQPLRRFPLDAAIVFSDILTIPDAMGLDLHFDDHGPRFAKPIRDVAAIHTLPTDVTSDTAYVGEAIRLIKRVLGPSLPLFGFSGSPWTLATYMVEGRLTKAFTHIKTLRYTEPEALVTLLDRLSQAITSYLQQQVAAGVDALMLFDTWGGILTEPDYLQYSIAFLQKVLATDYGVPVIVFTKGNGGGLQHLRKVPCQGYGIDWTMPLAKARQILGEHCVLQGNFDPTLLLGDPKLYPELVATTLAGMRDDPRLILNLGHGILPNTPIDHVHAWIDALSAYYGSGLNHHEHCRI
jgi:uroporphyrinogen decarboxylase